MHGRIDAGPAAPDEEVLYLQRRADEELEMAQRSTVPEATAAHYQLVEAYLERIEAKRAATASEQGPDGPTGSERGAPAGDRAQEAGDAGTGRAGR